MSDEYPVIDESGEELFFPNEWRTDQEQILGDTSCFNPDAQPNADENLIVMKLTFQQLKEMLSALYVGAEFCYPEKYLEVVRPLLAATSCPPILEEQDCFDYPTYASFVRYTPINPYIEPDTIPDGYETEPFLVNGENGNNIPNYQHYDVIVPSGAITLDANWWDTIAGVLPTIEVMAQGQGKVFLKMLTLPGGGLAVITIDNPPNLLDIISGIVTGADNIIDLNQDLVSLPPETAQELIFEVDLVGTGLHTIYIVFLPILDDSLIPVRFGGGFRGATLCDFVEQPTMGITALRFEACNLEMQLEGSWQIVPGWEDWLDCVPSGGGGGGFSLTSYYTGKYDMAAAATNATTNWVDIDANIKQDVTVVQNSTIFAAFYIPRGGKNTSGSALFRLVLDSSPGETVTIPFKASSDLAEGIWLVGWWNVGPGVHTIKPQFSSSNTATAFVTAGYSVTWEVEVVRALLANFVEDVRIVGRELQKKINGAWITVTDSLATILNAIESTANNALAAANSAIATNNTQQTQINSIITVNNQQNTRLTNLESFRTDAELELAQLALTVANHETRIDALEAETADIPSWVQEYNFLSNSHGWVGTTWTSGQGFVFSGDLNLILPGKTVFDSRIRFVEVRTRRFDGASPLNSSALFGGGSDFTNIKTTSPNLLNINWIKVPNLDFEYVPTLFLEALGANTRLEYMRIVGVGTFNPFS